jgi:hypothetical protein
MATKIATSNGFSVKAYQGDAKTLLAFNLSDKRKTAGLGRLYDLVPAKGAAGVL